MTDAYDPNVCYLAFVDDNYLFVVERSQGNCDASDSQRCSWDLQNDAKAPGAIPTSFAGPQTYFCDGNYRALAWPNTNTQGNAGSAPSGNSPPMPGGPPVPGGDGNSTETNGYRCVCGGPIDSNLLTHGRADRPWKGNFGKRCNVMTDYPLSHGDFESAYDATQGVCATMAGQSNNASLVVQGNFTYPDNGLTTIDKYGVVYYCDDNVAGPTVMGKPVQQVCNCNGPLPETVFGQQLTSQQRDACGLEAAKKVRAGIIAGSVIGGVLAIGLVCALVAILLLRRRKSKRSRSLESKLSDDDNDNHSKISSVEL